MYCVHWNTFGRFSAMLIIWTWSLLYGDNIICYEFWVIPLAVQWGLCKSRLSGSPHEPPLRTWWTVESGCPSHFMECARQVRQSASAGKTWHLDSASLSLSLMRPPLLCFLLSLHLPRWISSSLPAYSCRGSCSWMMFKALPAAGQHAY